MALKVTAEPDGELLTLEEAKQHLRYFASDADTEITALIRAARDDCERETGRTLREAVTRTWTMCEWWCLELKLPFPPLIGISSVTYYDSNNASQTLSSSNYHVELSTDGWGRIVWVTNATIPTLYDRPNAITVTFTTGYADASAVPPSALHALKVKCSELWAAGSEGEQRAAVECAKRLLGKVDATSYA